MWFHKKKDESTEYPFAGSRRAVDGHAAVFAVTSAACETVVVQTASDMAEITGPLRNLAPRDIDRARSGSATVHHVKDLQPLVGLAVGQSAAGLRTSLMVSTLEGVTESLRAAVGKRLPMVINVTCHAPTRHSGALHGAHDSYYSAADTGAFQLFARNAQEAADFALIAQRIAEVSLTPGICAQDLYRTSHSVQGVELAGGELADEYLGDPEDRIEAPTPAQAVLFGENRRRVPRLLDPDRPAGVGGVQDHDSHPRAVAAQKPFFADHLRPIIADAMREFGELTGRYYQPVSGYRVDDAKFVVVAQGAVAEALEVAADNLRENNIKAGVINVGMFRPFPGSELAAMLKGKTAVTVLERTDQPLAEDLPMMKEIRCAIDKAIENGVAEKEAPAHPGYGAYRNLSDRPRLYSGVFGVGGRHPSMDELLCVFTNMTGRDRGRTRFYVGSDFNRPASRYPHLQTLQQRLSREYPELQSLSLNALDRKLAPEPRIKSAQLHALAGQGGLFACNLFAQTIAEALGRSTRTFPLGGLEPDLQPAQTTILHTEERLDIKAVPPEVGTLLVSGVSILERLSSQARICGSGTVVVDTELAADVLWEGLSARTREWIRDRDLKLFVIDGRKIASEIASRTSFVDQLSVWALLGSYLKTEATITDDDVSRAIDGLRRNLERLFAGANYLVDEIANTLERGAAEQIEFDWRPLAQEKLSRDTEATAPWTVQAANEDESVFGVKRFWRSVGYFHDTGQPEQTLCDPYMATGLIPSGSSSFRDMAAYRLGLPAWLPENCTGCGMCWAMCPDSALPPTIQSISTILETAMTECSSQGASLIQLQRIKDQLARQAHRLYAKDELGQYLTAGSLLRESFSQLVEKMGLDDEKRGVLTGEFDAVCERVQQFPISRTDMFFAGPENEAKGDGRALTISLNPLSCKGCRLCVDVCPEDAFDWVDQAPATLKRLQRTWEFGLGLPDVPDEVIERHASAQAPDSVVNRLLAKSAYHSLVGGDGAMPGSGSKTAVHLLTAAGESVMGPRFAAYAGKLSSLIQNLENKIQGKVTRSVTINDFEEFGRDIARVGKRGLAPDELARLAGGEGKAAIDTETLERLTRLLNELKKQLRQYEAGSGTSRRARMLLAIDHGDEAFWSGTYPYNPHQNPWICHLPGDAPALAEGILHGMTRRLAEEFKVRRAVELELNDAYDPAEHDAVFARFGAESFTAEERNLIPPVLVLARSETTRWDAIAGLLARDVPVKIAVINNEGLTVDSALAATDGSGGVHRESDPGYLGLSYHGAFVLQSSIGNPGHLIQGVASGLGQNRPALFHIYAPDPLLNGIPAEKMAEQARLAYESRMFPLFESNPERKGAVLDLAGNPEQDVPWAQRELVYREASGAETRRPAAVTVADWAVNEARFRGHFKVLSKGHLHDQMATLSDYLAIEPAERETLEPYVEISDGDGRAHLAVLSAGMVAAAQERSEFWKHLQEIAAGVTTPAPAAVAEPEAAADDTKSQPPLAGAQLDQALFEKLTDNLLHLCGYSQDPAFFSQSLREFIGRGGREETGEPAESE